MKLFKSLLVAPATIGLLAPLAASANEVNLNEISNYSNLEGIEVVNSFENELSSDDNSIESIDARFNSFEAGSFSSTTTASFSADMAIGAIDGQGTSPTDPLGEEALNAIYGFQIDLNTTFTGEDSLDVSIDAGNASSTTLGELDLNGGTDGLSIDGVAYTFPLGDKTTVFVGDNMDGSTLFSTACVYGGPSNTLDDCGNVNSALGGGSGTAAGASYDFGNGVTAAFGYTGDGSDATKGIFTKESSDAIAGQVTYTADSYGVSATLASIETATSTTDLTALAGKDVSYLALNGYWIPEAGNLPSISVGYEMGNPEEEGAKDTTAFFVGFMWDEVGPGTLGAALGTTGHIASDATEYYMYEAFYDYPLNDGVTITPLVYLKETSDDDQTGVMVKTSFSF
ncbi:MAG: porin [Prochlorococcus marinus CUG1430]|nr:porin [Prochlorococcus marinus CUG1430]